MTQNTILSALTARKSVRVFTDEAVTAEERAAILNAAFQAPTAGNQQLYTILDITDTALKATLADLCDHQPFIAKAPLVLVFLADCRRWLNAYHAAGMPDARKPGYGDLMLAMADTCIAAQNAVCINRREFAICTDFFRHFAGDFLPPCRDSLPPRQFS